MVHWENRSFENNKYIYKSENSSKNRWVMKNATLIFTQSVRNHTESDRYYFQEFYSHQGLTPITACVFVFGTVIGIIGPIGIIWYERNCSNRFRTVVNQLVSTRIVVCTSLRRICIHSWLHKIIMCWTIQCRNVWPPNFREECSMVLHSSYTWYHLGSKIHFHLLCKELCRYQWWCIGPYLNTINIIDINLGRNCETFHPRNLPTELLFMYRIQSKPWIGGVKLHWSTKKV